MLNLVMKWNKCFINSFVCKVSKFYIFQKVLFLLRYLFIVIDCCFLFLLQTSHWSNC
ncbi:Lysophospholipid acyltransferase LPCAT4 [Frankliniella fusca]|uniref:Lysophospholipid acyltransferase LPCAT4 n=1 Tax=Frankliniella fusca TaxID=407009 RepID=A0AAE1HBA0_9NEOP|nr:Lysophospholipid acyltransferase LPCAT4 [Frankliniella fusca]KAK3917949.1 Lysophospholipid acyltransferase LPCAT4 [Frankliniella fusca]